LSASAPRPELSIVHEVGHFLDHEGIGRGGHLGSESGEISRIMQTIYESQAYRRLARLAGRRQIRVQLSNRARPQVLPLNSTYVQYLCAPKELFARAYAQFIVTVGRDPRLIVQLEAVQIDAILGAVYHVQWDEGDFVSIARAFEREFRNRQWIA